MGNRKRSLISVLALVIGITINLHAESTLQSSVTIDFSTPLLAVDLSDEELVHTVQRNILPVPAAGQQAPVVLAGGTGLFGGTVACTVDGRGVEVNLFAGSPSAPIYLTLVDEQEQIIGPFYLNGTEKELLDPLNNTYSIYQIVYDLVDGETENTDYQVDFSLE